MTTVVGLVMGLVAVWLVLEPLFRSAAGRPAAVSEPLFSDSDDDEDNPLLARRDRALAALKEIDFDRATGKLSDEDYERLKTRFTAEALAALRAADVPADPTAAPAPPGPDAGHPAPGPRSRRFCVECGTPIEGAARFCLECGSPVSAPV